ncbi:MAG: T9SS type B sorting domain-containing protein [Chitinophagaceae bacterium]|nr:T9SS type B sorting domain-containing protein [Chitinophagaceae bacterium]
MFQRILLSILLMLFAFSTKASHIVGGDITYTCLGNNTYEFIVSLYRDCLPPSQGGGNPAALESDNPAFITIYNGNNFYSFDSVYFYDRENIDPNFSNDCVNNPPATCINRIRFKFVKQLPASAFPYTLLMQRCCRNETINNILIPGTTGATYYCTIPPNICNNSANFNNLPPQIICVNNPFVYDHSATDPDGDSLSYEFCDAMKGADPNDPKPVITANQLPALSTVNYKTPYTAGQPMAGNPLVNINPITGLITGTPNIQGRFVVNVCVNEWRNGVIINTTRREFQFVVTNCSKAVVAFVPQLPTEPNTYIINCKSKTVSFINNSQGGFNYFWDFGVSAVNNDTSNLFQPTFTYPDTGTYKIKLVVNRGSTCPDSIERLVKIYPDFETKFDYSGLLCPNTPIQFVDQSTGTFGTINFWNWSFGDGTGSGIQNPVNSFANIGQQYNVRLISGNSFGCRDTASRILTVDYVNVFAGNDTIIVKNYNYQFNGSGADNFSWSPSTYLSDANIANPTAVFPDTGLYTYILHGTTNQGCDDYDTIRIRVADGPYITLPNAFTPNGDGLNDFFSILYAGYKKLNYMRIYNRWGELVYQTADFRKGWDGKHKGRDAEVGTYFWIISANNTNDQAEILKGDITLIR